jgi:phosphohistidine phosphatase SixA
MTTDFELFLMRHGDAESYAAGGDRARALTEEGHAAVTRAGGAFAALDWNWSVLVSSPYERADQTAEALWARVEPVHRDRYQFELPRVEHYEGLVPHGPPDEAARWLYERGQNLKTAAPRVVAVGHNPKISALASLLVTGEADGARFHFGCGDVLHLFVPGEAPMDSWLSGEGEELALPHCLVLGFYRREILERIAPTTGAPAR